MVATIVAAKDRTHRFRTIGPWLAGILVIAGAAGLELQRTDGSPPVSEPTVTLAAAGDILLDRGVGQSIERYGLEFPFARVGDRLKAADIAFGNLECPLSKDGVKVVKRFVFRARPQTARCLRGAGLDMLSLANNHTMDCGRRGLTDTMSILGGQGLRWCGAGATARAAEEPAMVTVRGLRVGFVGFCQFLPEGVFLSDDKPGLALATEERVRRVVSIARTKCDVVVASFHWGVEYQTRPSRGQRRLARIAVEAGADLVLGHHPHVLQGLEVVKSPWRGRRNVLIAYSLGNFVFDAPPQWQSATAPTMILHCTLSRRGVQNVQAEPFTVEHYRPRPATIPEAKKSQSRLTELSAELNTRVVAGTLDISNQALPERSPGKTALERY